MSRSDDGVATNGFTYTAASIKPSGDGDDVFARTAAGSLVATATSGGTSDTVFPVFSTRNDLLALVGADGVEVGSKHFEPFGEVEASSGRATALGFQTDWTDLDTEHVWIWVRQPERLLGGINRHRARSCRVTRLLGRFRRRLV